MVRVKNRYLVVNFLYPEPPTKTKSKLPAVIQIHSPTPDALKPGFIVRMIRDGVEELFGDYGSGMVASGLKGTLPFSSSLSYTYACACAVAYTTVTNTRPLSELLFPFNQYSHNPMSPRPLRNGLGRPHIHYAPPATPRYARCDSSGAS